MVFLRVLILLLSWAAGLGGEARPRVIPRTSRQSGGRAERSSGARRRTAGATVSPTGRRRHSGAPLFPLAIVPRAATAFPSVAGRGGSEPPARPSPPPLPGGTRGGSRLPEERSRELGVSGREPRPAAHPSCRLGGRGRRLLSRTGGAGRPCSALARSPSSPTPSPQPRFLSPLRRADSWKL
jgi:hypothetical protein